eukprot:2783446-Pyramimonas_sp.AAC.1
MRRNARSGWRQRAPPTSGATATSACGCGKHRPSACAGCDHGHAAAADQGHVLAHVPAQARGGAPPPIALSAPSFLRRRRRRRRCRLCRPIGPLSVPGHRCIFPVTLFIRGAACWRPMARCRPRAA